MTFVVLGVMLYMAIIQPGVIIALQEDKSPADAAVSTSTLGPVASWIRGKLKLFLFLSELELGALLLLRGDIKVIPGVM